MKYVSAMRCHKTFNTCALGAIFFWRSKSLFAASVQDAARWIEVNGLICCKDNTVRLLKRST